MSLPRVSGLSVQSDRDKTGSMCRGSSLPGGPRGPQSRPGRVRLGEKPWGLFRPQRGSRTRGSALRDQLRPGTGSAPPPNPTPPRGTLMLAEGWGPVSAAAPGPTGSRVCTGATLCPACLGVMDRPGGRSLANQGWLATPISEPATLPGQGKCCLTHHGLSLVVSTALPKTANGSTRPGWEGPGGQAPTRPTRESVKEPSSPACLPAYQTEPQIPILSPVTVRCIRFL